MITALKVNQLVMDSFSAISLAQKEPIDARVLFHLLYHFLKEMHCVSLVIVDKPWGSELFGGGGIEFIADGIILLETFFDENNRLQRKLKILKMRGTNHTKQAHEYDICKDGFKVLQARKEKPSRKKYLKKF